MKELDRFATTYKKDIQIATKLLGMIGAAVIVACAVSVFVTLTNFYRGFLSDSKDSLTYAFSGVKDSMDEWGAEAIHYGEVLAETPDIKMALQNGDSQSFSGKINELGRNLDVDFIALVDSVGKIVDGAAFGCKAGNVSDSTAVKKVFASELLFMELNLFLIFPMELLLQLLL